MSKNPIEIHTGDPNFRYSPVRLLEATCQVTPLYTAESVEVANAKLKKLASKVHADAVINVEYNADISIASKKAIKATGLAVRRVTDDAQIETTIPKEPLVAIEHSGGRGWFLVAALLIVIFAAIALFT
jgi:hypothetical protein